MRALIAASLAALSIGGAYAADTLAPVPTVAEENPKGTLDRLSGQAIPNTDPVQYYPAGGSAYTLTKLQEGGEKPTGENVITKFTYNSETHTLSPIYYRLDLNKTEYGSGDSVKYYGWTTNENGDKTFGEVDAADAEILGRYDTSNQLNRIDSTTSMTGSDIEGNFINQTLESVDSSAYGGAIRNDSQLGNVTGDFVDNAITSNVATFGGAISGGIFGDIEGDFIGNSATTTEYQDSGSILGAHGAAINQANTGNITGNFIGNHVSTPESYATGGAIYTYAGYTLGDITGDFIGNYAEGVVENTSGGAINNYGSTIGKITGNFIGNYASNVNGNAYGGAINHYWHAEIGDITGDFIGNYAKTVSGEAQGGAIWMMHNGNKLNNITGDFIGNYAESDSGTAEGGAIYNNSFLEDEPSIKSITGDFIDNHVKGSSAYGGAIYNTNTIGDIDGDFYNNYALGSTTKDDVTYIDAYGGAVYNSFSGVLGTITGNFINNYVRIDTPSVYSAYGRGGAINSAGTIAGLVGYFINNHIESEHYTTAYGGAIYNNGTIDNIQGGFYGNYIDVKTGAAHGGAIYNYKTITNIEADFVDNNVSGSEAMGGAIHNHYGSQIGTLSGNFSGNSAVASQANALGGAINNYSGFINTLNGDFTDNLAQSVSSAFGGAIYNSSSINEINSNFSGNIADGKNDASGGAVYNLGNLGFEMDYVKGVFANNEARSENYAIGGAVYNSNYIGTGLSNSGIDGTFTNNKAIAAEPVARPYSSEGYPGYGEEEFASHYAAGGAIYNAGIIKNIKGDYNNNLAQVSFADSNALAEGGAILAVTDNIATSALSDEYMQSGEINVPSTIIDGDSGADYFDANILQCTVKVGDETRTVYLPPFLNLSESGINTIVSADLGEMTEEEWNEAMAAGTVYTSLDQLQNAYNKQIMKISANFDSNKAEAAISGDARGGAISFVETNSDFTPLPPSNGISTMSIAPDPGIDISGGGALINHTTLVVDGEVLSEFNILGTTLPEGSKIGYVNLLPQKEYIIENSTFTNNAAVANNGNAYGGAVSITSNPGQLNIYGEQEISMTEEEFISFIQDYAGTEITSKEEALAVFNAMLEEMKTAGMVSDADNVQDLILEGYETVSSSKNKFIFKNTSFVNNTAEASGDNAEAHGGAIYSQSDVTIQADNAESIISGNTTITNGTVDQEAIYMDKSEFSEEPLVLELDTINNGKILLDDKINGSEQYIVNLTGDSTGQIVSNNSVNNAHIITNDGSNTFLTKETHWDGNDLTMNGGNLSFLNNSVGVASLNNITVTKDTNFVADVDLANESMDRFTANTYGEHTGNLHVTGMNLLSDAPEDRDVTEIYFAEQGLKDNVINGVSGGTGELPDSYQTTAYTPIYRYNVAYDNRDDAGYFVFAKGDRIIQTPGGGTTGGGGITTTPSGNPSDAFNPAVLSSPVAAQAGAYAAQYAAFNYAFEHADTFMPLPSNERFALKNANRYAITGYDNMVYNTSDFPSKAMWVRPYTSFENISLKNGPDVDTITYGTLIGGNSDLKELKNGWSTIFTGYVGYNGSSQSYSGVNTYQNGGLLGATQTFYKGNFFTAVTASTGAMAGESHNMYGHENFTTLLAGVASKTGYNFEFKDGKFIIQPIWLMSYSFINTFDYTNSAGVRIDSDPLHAIQLNPSVRFIANMKNGWQPYASVGMVWNILDDTKVRANDVRLPEMSVKPFVEYGLGIQKRWNDKYTGYLQAMVRNGGRTGVALTAGFRWALGNEGKPVEKVKKDSSRTERIGIVK